MIKVYLMEEKGFEPEIIFVIKMDYFYVVISELNVLKVAYSPEDETEADITYLGEL